MSPSPARSARRCAAPPRPGSSGSSSRSTGSTRSSPALAAGATHLLLDNMDVAALREAVALVAGRVPTEASGGITLETIRAKAETGRHLHLGRPPHPVRAGRRHRPGFRPAS